MIKFIKEFRWEILALLILSCSVVILAGVFIIERIAS